MLGLFSQCLSNSSKWDVHHDTSESYLQLKMPALLNTPCYKSNAFSFGMGANCQFWLYSNRSSCSTQGSSIHHVNDVAHVAHGWWGSDKSPTFFLQRVVDRPLTICREDVIMFSFMSWKLISMSKKFLKGTEADGQCNLILHWKKPTSVPAVHPVEDWGCCCTALGQEETFSPLPQVVLRQSQLV